MYVVPFHPLSLSFPSVLIISSVKPKKMQHFRLVAAFHKEPRILASYHRKYYTWLLVAATANNSSSHRWRRLAAMPRFIKFYTAPFND